MLRSARADTAPLRPRAQPETVAFGEACRAWVKVAAHSFGGPAGQIAVLHRVVVDEKRWLDERNFLHALGYCMLLPGPEAQQLATYVGWKLHGVRGGLVAGGLFILPGFVSILALSIAYARFGETTALEAVFYGLKPAVLAIVLQALLRLRARALHGTRATALAVAAFGAMFLFGAPFPLVIAAAALLALAFDRAPAAGADVVHQRDDGSLAGTHRRSVAGALAWLALWLVPVALLVIALAPGHVLARQAVFFSKMAVVTFGGAYAVLAYVAQQAVEVYGWLTPDEMLDGLGLAETTPGPLIQVVQFVAFLAAYRNPAGMDPLLAGVLGSIVTTWVTFAPCFLFIFAGAPFLETIFRRPRVQAAMRGITAAVVGVVLNLAVWFSAHTLFAETRRATAGPLAIEWPVWSTVDAGAAAIAVVAAVMTLRYRAGMFAVLAFGVGAGALLSVLR